MPHGGPDPVCCGRDAEGVWVQAAVATALAKALAGGLAPPPTHPHKASPGSESETAAFRAAEGRERKRIVRTGVSVGGERRIVEFPD